VIVYTDEKDNFTYWDIKKFNAAGGKLWHTLYYSEEIVVRNSYLIYD